MLVSHSPPCWIRQAVADEAFHHLHAANQLMRARLAAAGTRFHAAALRAYVDERIGRCTPDFFAAHRDWGNSSELPVFVVGMIRSGSTLTEQILASHPRIFGIGEANYIGAVGTALNGGMTDRVDRDWTRDACLRAANSHIVRLRVMGGGAARVIDKTLDNLFHLGMIAVLFPRARVIVCRRDPRDVALSCYFQSFAEPIPFAYDLADCATRIREVDRMLAHWQTALPLPMHTLQYERLVAEPEKETRRLIAFLGLEWDSRCLGFHRTQRPVRSASLWQVRRPLYGGSVGRWRHYASHIAPLLDAFGRD